MNIEIEKKYVILKPDEAVMSAQKEYTRSDITQTYLIGENGVTHRVRKRVCCGKTVYTETKKRRIDRMSSQEDEREISEDEYSGLIVLADPASTPIEKVRHTFTYLGQFFEIDVYPCWKNTAIMETELDDRETAVSFPSFIKILLEVTGDRRFSNAAMSRSFPKEII